MALVQDEPELKQGIATIERLRNPEIKTEQLQLEKAERKENCFMTAREESAAG